MYASFVYHLQALRKAAQPWLDFGLGDAMIIPIKILGCEFEHVGGIELIRSPDVSVGELMPRTRYKNVRNLPLNKCGAVSAVLSCSAKSIARWLTLAVLVTRPLISG
jgi:hypothetical protein